MNHLPAPLTPRDGERGLVTRDLAAVGQATVAAWDLFLGVAATVDPAAPARAKGRTALQVVVHVGAWEESRRLEHILADARAGRQTGPDHDAAVERVLAAHAHADPGEALAAVRRARDEAADWFARTQSVEEAGLTTPSPLGPVPVGTLVHASAYQLAVAALDLVPAGADPPEALLSAGLLALVDSAGAIAGRAGATASIATITPQGRFGTGASGGWWRTVDVPDPTCAGPAIEGDVRTVLDVTSGRMAPPLAYARGDLQVRDLPGLLRIARLMGSVDGLPGGDALRRGLAVMDGLGGLIGRLPGRRRG